MGGMTLPVDSAVLRFALLDGAADSATAGIDCADLAGNALAYGDEIVAAVELVTGDNTPTDRTSAAGITAGGNLTVPDSANDKVAVWWMAKTSDSDSVPSPRLQSALVTGGSAGALTCAGIAVGDSIVSAVEINASTGAWTDRSSVTTITDTNEITCSQATTGNKVWVIWMDKTGTVTNSNALWKFTLATAGLSAESLIAVSGLTTVDDVMICLAADESDADALEELSSVVTIPSDGYIVIGATSPTDVASCKLWIFWHDRVE